MDSVSPSEYYYTYYTAESVTLKNVLAKVRELVAPYRFRLAADCIIKELSINRNSSILEIGSGLGLLGKAIKELTKGEIDYFGIELTYKSAEESSKKGLIEVQADAISLPFPNNSFDRIISTDVLEHIPDNEQAVKEIHRVLKPKGQAFIVIADPSEGRFSKVNDHIKRSNQASDIDYWENLFLKNGFKISEKSKKYRGKDWRKIFDFPFLIKLKDKPFFACAFNPVCRPGVYIIEKTE